MNRFNLTFSGEILPGHDPELVKVRFANLFEIDDPERLKLLFSGGTFILRHNLERKDAARYYHELQLLGVGAALVKVTASERADEIVNASRTPKSSKERTTSTRSASAATQNSAAAVVRAQPDAAGWPANTADAAAAIKARKLAAQQLAAEQAALASAALEEEQRHIAAAAARDQAIVAERLRTEGEERARREAEQIRIAALEAARKEAERAELKRLEAEEIARKKALKAQAKRKAAEASAQRKAARNQQKAEKTRRKAEEAALRKAEIEEQKRLAAEAEARRTAELEKQNRLAAEEEARRKAAIEEQKRLAAEEEARHKARVAEQKRLAAEEETRRIAELEKQKRLAAEEEARRLAEIEELERLAAAEEARRKAAIEKQKRLAAPGRQHTSRSTRARVKTTLDIPFGKQAEETPAHRKRMPGEPNLYTLRPFRNSEEVRTRAARARQHMRRAYTLGVLALAALLIAGGSFVQHGQYPVISGADALVINPKLEPLLLAGDALLFHDRAGVSTTSTSLSALGLSALAPPLVFDGSDRLVARGRLADEGTAAAQDNALQLLRCDIASSTCETLSTELADRSIEAFAINPLDGSLLLADTGAGELLKIDSAGAVIAHTAVSLPQHPVLRMRGGLLLMNSAAAPAISVFRYEDDAFGAQLDEILLLPTTAQSLARHRVHDFVWSGDAWWVNLIEPASGRSEIHRFDQEWNHLGAAHLPADAGALQLLNWGEKTLANDPRDPSIQRYNRAGEPEAPFTSGQLQDLINRQQQRASFAAISWQIALLLCALAVVAGMGLGYLHSARSLVYKMRREQGAEPLDNYTAQLHWVDPIADRHPRLQKTGIQYGLAVLAAVLLAIALSVTVWQMAALLLALSGPAVALLLLNRQPTGHIGTVDDKLLLVDHSGMYQLASGSRLQYRGPFLVIDDVVVFAGNRLLPAFAADQIQRQVRPLALGGIKVDQKTLVVKLLQCRHPLAQGAVAILAALASAALLLGLQGVY